jgi:hypothetical protein
LSTSFRTMANQPNIRITNLKEEDNPHALKLGLRLFDG